ncbi:MAG: nitronate monooxygenase, partial [Myxococcota bacterium]|nr:nitronate monooxygenase [Myxococcota bacterium]
MSKDRMRSIGAWVPADRPLQSGDQSLVRGLGRLNAPLHLVDLDGSLAWGPGGRVALGRRPSAQEHPLVAFAPALPPSRLGDAGFLTEHGASLALVGGAMANGIASEELVEALASEGILAFFGSAGCSLARIEAAIERLQGSLVDRPWGMNLIHSPGEPELEAATVDLYLRREVRTVSASAYIDLTLPLVRFRVAGLFRDSEGRIHAPNRVLAKVSRSEVARRFLQPPPERFLTELLSSGEISEEQAAMARQIPMAEDITAEADSGGHTDNRPLVVLLPELLALRDEVSAEQGYPQRPRVGCAGGISTPSSVAAAFSMGAAYVVAGSVLQACVESGSSDLVRGMLAAASPS